MGLSNKKGLSIIIFLYSILAFNLQAQEKGFDVTWKKDGVIIGGSLALYISGQFSKASVTPLTQDQINDLDPNTINAFDRGATRQNRTSDANLSNYFLGLAALTPLATLGFKEARRDVVPVLVMYLETALTINGVTDISKGLTQRIRPFVYNPDSDLEKTTSNARQSFFSGHVSNSAAFCFLSAFLVNEYAEGKALKVIAWTGAVVIPTTVSVFRYTSGKHFPTDIITGFVVGAGIGVLIPYLHRRELPTDVSQNLKFDFMGNGFRLVYTF